jgi:hypothetical protein
MFTWMIALVTLPGVILHEWAHKFFCERTGVPVYKTRYFRLGNPAGYVLHGPVDSYVKAFLIAIAPFLVNTAVAIILFVVAVIIPLGLIALLLYWLGISIAMHSFPSSQDADSLWQYSKRNWWRNPLALFGFPVIGLIKLAGMLNSVWFDLLYAVFLLVLVAAIIKGGDLFSIGI